MSEINGREYYLDELGRPRWLDNDRLVPPIAWELHVNQGRKVKTSRGGTYEVGKSIQRPPNKSGDDEDDSKKITQRSWK